jgi:hypothetical protein
MSWTWRLEAADGSLVTTQSAPAHPNQSDAESWLGENWRELAEAGVARVTLLDGTTEIYGPMSLAEE